MRKISAKKALEYLKRYKKYLEENNLHDDTNYITLEDVISFCDMQLCFEEN